MNEKDILELYDEQERGILEKLGRMDMDDPNRKKLIDELTARSSIRKSYEENEQNRLSNNARNDVEEAKLLLEKEKIKNEKDRNIMFLVQGIVGVLFGAGLHYKSYHMDEKGYPYKNLQQYGDRLVEKWSSLIGRGR